MRRTAALARLPVYSRRESSNAVDHAEAVEAVAQADSSETAERASRLVELTDRLGEDIVGFSGQGAAWLFEDVKATWIYGYFTATVLVSNAFCLQQLAGLLRLLPDDPSLPESTTSLFALAALAEECGAIDLELRARLVTLDDITHAYASADLHEYRAEAERRASDTADFSDEHTLWPMLGWHLSAGWRSCIGGLDVIDEDDDFQRRATQEGRQVQEIARKVLRAAGFSDLLANEPLDDLGVTVNFIAQDKTSESGMSTYRERSRPRAPGSFAPTRCGRRSGGRTCFINRA